jgi:hypothetical protein
MEFKALGEASVRLAKALDPDPDPDSYFSSERERLSEAFAKPSRVSCPGFRGESRSA